MHVPNLNLKIIYHRYIFLSHQIHFFIEVIIYQLSHRTLNDTYH
jgi:hypothetical protein